MKNREQCISILLPVSLEEELSVLKDKYCRHMSRTDVIQLLIQHGLQSVGGSCNVVD